MLLLFHVEESLDFGDRKLQMGSSMWAMYIFSVHCKLIDIRWVNFGPNEKHTHTVQIRETYGKDSSAINEQLTIDMFWRALRQA